MPPMPGALRSFIDAAIVCGDMALPFHYPKGDQWEGWQSGFRIHGLTGEDLVAPINQRLTAEGMPPVRADQVVAAAQTALRESVQKGGVIDRERLVTVFANKTALSRSDAERVAGTIDEKWAQLKTRTGEVARDVQHTALEAAETTGKVLLTLSITMLVGLGAAIFGAFLSVRHERREHVVLPRAMTR